MTSGFVKITPLELAERFLGLDEVPGAVNNPQIMAMLQLDVRWPTSDEVPWCSGFVNYICWLLGIQRSKSLLARSWIEIGEGVDLDEARACDDVVILKRGNNPRAGHVGFFAGRTSGGSVRILGGNQSNCVTIQSFNTDRILSIRRLIP